MARQIVEGSLYPNPDEAVPEPVMSCALSIAKRLGGKKLAEKIGKTLVWKNAYDPPLYQRDEGAAPEDAEFKRVDEFFKKHLGERDAFILVGRAKIPKKAKIEAA
jgi:hypothetical protein